MHVRSGSLASKMLSPGDVRFTPESGHPAANSDRAPGLTRCPYFCPLLGEVRTRRRIAKVT
jgi:hypothetical protein